MPPSRRKELVGTLYRVGVRARWLCHICGQGADPADPWELEHIRSKRDRGMDSVDNYGLSHRSCNRIKGADSWISSGPLTS